METEALSAVVTECWDEFKADYASGPPLSKKVGGGTPSCIHWSEADIQHRIASLLERKFGDGCGLAVHLEVNLGVSTVDLAVASQASFIEPLKNGENFNFADLVRKVGGLDLAAEIAVLLETGKNTTCGIPKIENNLKRLQMIQHDGLAKATCLFVLDKTAKPEGKEKLQALHARYSDVALMTIHDPEKGK